MSRTPKVVTTVTHFFESGIILPIPEAEPIVGDLRRAHDPQARYGVPAHITLLYPFAHPSAVVMFLTIFATRSV